MILKKNKIQIIPKKTEPEDNDDVNLPKWQSKLFSETDQQVTEEIDCGKNEIDMKNLTQILSKFGKFPLEFKFFTGHESKKFDDTMRSYGLSTDNLEFLDFLQSQICKKILATNKVKIYVETGNIYYDNNDTGESSFAFFSKTKRSS